MSLGVQRRMDSRAVRAPMAGTGYMQMRGLIVVGSKRRLSACPNGLARGRGITTVVEGSANACSDGR
jgi:hypothetical protein